MRKPQELPQKGAHSLHLPALYNRPAGWNLARRHYPTPTYSSGTWSPAQQLSCTQAFPMGPAGPRLGGVGPCQELQPYRALNGRSCSQVPRTEAPAPASATPQEPWPGEREWAWAWGRVGSLQGHAGGGGPSKFDPWLEPLAFGVPGHLLGTTFLGLGRPYHPQPHQPPTLGRGSWIC